MDTDLLVLAALGMGLYWHVAGALLTGESSHISRRVRRGLPQTGLGRAFFTWFQPGSGTGYLFATVNLLAWVLLLAAPSLYFVEWFTSPINPKTLQWLVFLVLGFSYIVAFLGIGRIVIAILRRWTDVSMLGVFLIQFLLVLAASGIPYVIQMTTPEMRNLEYSYWQVTNPIWTLHYMIDYGSLPAETLRLLLLIPGAAICVFLANLPSVRREMQLSRLELPQRVIEEEAELHPEPAALPTSPWDEANSES